jgi:ribosomal-protein-alanine N-acetyltransferase
MNTKLITERLQLRLLQQDDAEVVYALRSNPIVGKYIIRPLCANILTAEAFVAKTINSIEKGAVIIWAIILKAENKMIGSICFWNFSEDRKTAELGYDLLPEYHNKGIMSEAFQAVLTRIIHRL